MENGLSGEEILDTMIGVINEAPIKANLILCLILFLIMLMLLNLLMLI